MSEAGSGIHNATDEEHAQQPDEEHWDEELPLDEETSAGRSSTKRISAGRTSSASRASASRPSASRMSTGQASGSRASASRTSSFRASEHSSQADVPQPEEEGDAATDLDATNTQSAATVPAEESDGSPSNAKLQGRRSRSAGSRLSVSHRALVSRAEPQQEPGFDQTMPRPKSATRSSARTSQGASEEDVGSPGEVPAIDDAQCFNSLHVHKLQRPVFRSVGLAEAKAAAAPNPAALTPRSKLYNKAQRSMRRPVSEERRAEVHERVERWFDRIDRGLPRNLDLTERQKVRDAKKRSGAGTKSDADSVVQFHLGLSKSKLPAEEKDFYERERENKERTDKDNARERVKILAEKALLRSNCKGFVHDGDDEWERSNAGMRHDARTKKQGEDCKIFRKAKGNSKGEGKEGKGKGDKPTSPKPQAPKMTARERAQERALTPKKTGVDKNGFVVWRPAKSAPVPLGESRSVSFFGISSAPVLSESVPVGPGAKSGTARQSTMGRSSTATEARPSLQPPMPRFVVAS